MQIKTTQLQFDTATGVSLIDLNDDLRAFIAQSGIRNGLLTVTSHHTTTALTINENESRLLDDVRLYLHRLVPPEDAYLHNDIHLRDCPQDEPLNAHAHIAAMLMGQSESIPVVDGELSLGQWQSVMLVELDGARTRRVNVHLMGA